MYMYMYVCVYAHVRVTLIPLSRRRPIDEVELRHISFELLEGLRYLHEHGVMHRDVRDTLA